MGNTNFSNISKQMMELILVCVICIGTKSGDDGIDYVDENGNLMDKKGGWKVRWLPAGCYDVIGEPSPISKEGWKKIGQTYVDKSLRRHSSRRKENRTI